MPGSESGGMWDQYDHVLRQLHGIGLGNGRDGEMRLESGHYMGLDHPSEENGGRWSLAFKHPGDPFGSWFKVSLGRDYAQAGNRAAREMRHPDVMRHLQDQYSRAELAGDPQGMSHRGGPGPFADTPSAVFSNYGD